MKVLQHRLGARLVQTSLAMAIASLWSTPLFAGGTANDNQYTQGAATAGAGQAAEGGDASVIFFNPAALTRLKRAELVNTAAFAAFENSYRSNINNDGAPTAQGTQGSAGQTFNRRDGYDAALLIPALFIAIPVNEKLVMGFSASGSHGLMARYDQNFPGRGQGREIDFKVTRLNLGFGYKMSPTLSVGFNGSYERYFQSIKLRLNFRDAINKLAPGSAPVLDAYSAINPAATIPGETDASLRMFGWAFNGQAGVLWEPTERTRIGASYRPKTRFRGNTGKLEVNENENTAAFREFLQGPEIALLGPVLGANGPQAAGDLAPFQRIKQDIDFPDELRLTVFHHATPKLDLMATYTRQDYTVSQIRFVRESNNRVLEDIPQNFQVAHSYRFGLNYRLYKRLTLHAGYARENGVVKDDLRVPILPDNDRQFYGIGASYDLSRDTTLSVGYQLLDIKAGAVGNNKSITPVEVSGANFNGTTDLNLHFFSVGVIERF